jgi:hypothetical protein
MINGTLVYIVANIAVSLVSLATSMLLKYHINPDKFGPKTFDNILVTTIFTVSFLALHISFFLFCLSLTGEQWNFKNFSALLTLLVLSWGSGLNAYRLGYKTNREWGT